MAATTYPVYGFRDGRAGLSWMIDVLGYEQVKVLENPENGAIEHAELKFGNSFVIGDEAERAKPGSISSYTEFTSEAALNAYAADLRNKGAKFVRELHTTGCGAQEFEVEGPEQSSWSFGTYVPGTLGDKGF